MVGLLDLCARGQSDVTSAERIGVLGDLRLRRFLQSGEEESQCGWCVVSSFTTHTHTHTHIHTPALSLPLSLSLSLSQCWSSSLLVVCLLFDLLRSREIRILHRFSLLIGSNWVFFVFNRKGHGLAEKLLLIIFIFWKISSTFRYALILCVEAPFSILKKVSASITSGECSRGR